MPELFLYLPLTSRQFGIGSASVPIKSAQQLREVTTRIVEVTKQIDPTLPVQFSMGKDDRRNVIVERHADGWSRPTTARRRRDDQHDTGDDFLH